MEQDILGKINQLKSNVQNIWSRFSDHDFELAKKTISDVSDIVKDRITRLTEGDDEVHPIHIDNYHYESHYPDDDLPLTLAKDSEPGIRYYDTENSPLSAGESKGVPEGGLDKFGDEKDEVFEEETPRRRVSETRSSVKKKRQLH